MWCAHSCAMAFGVVQYVLRKEREERRERARQELRIRELRFEERSRAQRMVLDRVVDDDVEQGAGTSEGDHFRNQHEHCPSAIPCHTEEVEVGVSSGYTSEEEEEDLQPGVETAECRICQERERIDKLESPCACSGSLKYVHRSCLERWANEKGNSTCEICKGEWVGVRVQPSQREEEPSRAAESTAFVGWLIPRHGTEHDEEARLQRLLSWKRYGRIFFASFAAFSIFNFSAWLLQDDSPPMAELIVFSFQVLILLIPFFLVWRIMAIFWKNYHSRESPRIFIYNGFAPRAGVGPLGGSRGTHTEDV